MKHQRWIGYSVATLAVVISLSGTRAAAQTNYTYTVIADVSGCYNVGTPVIGNNGEVAFAGVCGAATVVRKGDGATLTDIHTFTDTGYSIALPDVSINDVGTVAFVGGHQNGYVVLYGNGGPLTVVADTSVQTQWSQVGRASINNAHAVAFHVVPAGAQSFNTVVRADGGGVFTTIGQPGMTAPNSGTLVDAFGPVLNNTGQVGFIGNTTANVYGIFRGSGGALTRIVSGQGHNYSGINDAGRVAFESGNAVRSGTGSSLTTIAASGAMFAYFAGGAVAINNSNAVAFGAQTQAGPSGIFVGDGIATQAVIQTGAVLPGLGTVTWAGITNDAINDSGQVALFVSYDDAGVLKRAIVRADPILPQITQLKLAATVAGCLNASATVILDRPAPPGGVVIDIVETNPAATAPSTLKIGSNKTSGKFVVKTTPVTAKATGSVSATLGSTTQSKPFTVRPIGVQSVALSPNPVVGGNAVVGTATLECAASPNDITVFLASAKPSVAQPAVASVVVPAGTRAMTFQVNTSTVTASTTAAISATANGIKKSKALTVTP